MITKQTPAQQAGFIVNVTRLKITNPEHARYNEGLVWLLREDDTTSLPFFKSECGTVSNECFFICDFSIILDEVPAVPDIPVAPALTMQEALAAPLPVAPVYTALQQQAIDTFQAMYDAAVKHREGLDSRLNGEYGICDNIDRFATLVGASYSQMAEVKENLIRRTAVYSGSYNYPVPCPEGGNAGSAFDNNRYKWQGAYGLNRLTQLGQMIEIIKSDKWNDNLVNRQSPATRNGLTEGDIVRYTRRDESSLWVFRRDDDSMSPSFHKLTDEDNYCDIDLNYIVKVDKDSVFKRRPVEEFLSELVEQVKKKEDIESQIAELQKQLNGVKNDIFMLDYGLADQHKVKRI